MSKYTKEEIQKKVEELKSLGNEDWNHQFNLNDEVRTRENDINSPGYNVNKWKRLEPIFEDFLKDKFNSLLDVGCSDGYYSIQVAKKNNSCKVSGIDLDPLRIERSNFVKQVLQVDNCNFEKKDLYQLLQEKKSYDVVMGLGLLHRVPNMEKCVEDLCCIANKYVIFEFKSIRSDESEFIDHGGRSKSNKFNGLYKTPSKKYVESLINQEGFKLSLFLDDDSNLNFPRLIIVGEKK